MFPSSNTPLVPLDVILGPLIWTVIGLIVWYIGLRVEFNTEKTTVKWLSFVPLGIGLLCGIIYVYRTFDFAYRDLMLAERKLLLYSHYVALLIPLGAIGFVLGWEWLQKRQTAQSHF